jgi:hypothetical protein
MIPMIPTPDSIPTAWGYFQFLLLLTFPLHLLLMNSMLGSTFVAIFLHLRGRQKSRELAYELAKVIPLLIALTVNLGVAPLLFLQVLYGHFIYPSSVLMGLFWIMVIPALIIAYYAAYWYDFKFASLGQAGIMILAFVLLAFLAIGFMLSNNMTLMLHPESWVEYLKDSSGTLLNTKDVVLWPRYLHFMVGGTAVGGLFVALYGQFIARKDPVLGAYAKTTGMKLFLILTSLQIVVGIWFLVSLPKEQMLRFMGGDPLATGCFVVAIILVVLVLASAFREKLYTTLLCLVGLVYVMSFMRDFLRRGYLQDYFSPGTLTVVPEYSPLIFFLGTLVVGLGLLVWMIRAAFTRCTD